MESSELKYPSAPHIKCLDKGFVALIDHMGNDKRIVDAARVSYQGGTKKAQSDRHLIRYLIRNHHTTPLEKVRFEFHVKLPIFVARQYMRHRMGSFNEVSARYSVMPDEFYIPDPLRKQSESNRQGSSNEMVEKLSDLNPIRITEDEETGDVSYLFDDPKDASAVLKSWSKDRYIKYEYLLEEGVARELARIVLPVNLYTEFYWTVDLWNLMHFLRLRLDGHAQYEIRVFGEAILQLIKEHCDLEYALEAFEDYVLDAPNLTKYEIECIRSLVAQTPEESIRLQEMIDEHPNMSKREKAESRLIKLLFGEG